MSKRQHVVPHPDGWAVRKEGSDRVTSIHPTQRDAFDRAREIAINQRTEVVTHRPDGRIRDSDSYGNDPNPPKDRRPRSWAGPWPFQLHPLAPEMEWLRLPPVHP